MSDDETICYLLTTLPLAAWRRIAEALRRIIGIQYGSVTITIMAGKVFTIEHTISERINDNITPGPDV